jgi:hypothetical protein
MYSTQDYRVLGLCPSSGILRNTKDTTFRKVDLFPSGEEVGDVYSVRSVRKRNVQ